MTTLLPPPLDFHGAIAAGDLLLLLRDRHRRLPTGVIVESYEYYVQTNGYGERKLRLL
jgi:hypothetical protein